MEATVKFCYGKKIFKIQCTVEEKMEKIFQRFAKELNCNININDFDLYYEGKKINNDSTVLKLTGNKEIQNFYVVFLVRKSKIIKCPFCISNDTIIKIENFRLKFDGCKHNHSDKEFFDDYEQCQKIDSSEIMCSEKGCRNNVEIYPADFYKCYDCTKIQDRRKYYCNKCINQHTKSYKDHKIIKYDEKNYYCEEHFKKFIKYCDNCNKDLCEDCEGNHKDNHNIITYESMEEKTKNIRDSINKIKNYIRDLEFVVKDIKRSLEISVNAFKKYCIIADDILNKYKTYNRYLKNHRVLQSVINLNDSNEKVMEDINSIINKKHDIIIEQAEYIIKIGQKIYRDRMGDIEDFIKNSQNNINLFFTSISQDIKKSISCKNTDTISKIEEKIYDEYPKYKDYNTYLTGNGNIIKRFKTIEENGIKEGNNILINKYDE